MGTFQVSVFREPGRLNRYGYCGPRIGGVRGRRVNQAQNELEARQLERELTSTPL